jgi:hypothetical protein
MGKCPKYIIIIIINNDITIIILILLFGRSLIACQYAVSTT